MQLNKVKGSAPLYIQIRDMLVERINAGEWGPGDSIPSETQLAQDLDVSQGTVRQAITELVENNVLMRRQGRGTFVAQHDNQRDLFHFFHIADENGHKVLPDSETLAFRRKRANKQEAEKLGLESGTSVSVIERIRKLDGHPTLLETITLPVDRFADLGRLEAAEL
ncbi:MAG: GntR family transcriptional regulator, partial [Gammaproteobacteria bacterium]